MAPRKKSFPKSLPALARAQRVTEWASTLGFDWPESGPVWKKVEEEMDELKKAASSGDRRRVSEEMGDLLLSLVNLSRFLEVEAEDSLGDAVERFLRRFAHVEARIEGQGRKLRDASLEEMDRFWEEAKRMERE
ncbi:MAG TPA: MazG nucleotide pyrophosphohydrolase domain-containing protein [Candidatus Binatia bacterium]|nr:MazG nucleotide pyrophosphohydrolase domain-containing protein [Candidatus Binatia bacterium]